MTKVFKFTSTLLPYIFKSLQSDQYHTETEDCQTTSYQQVLVLGRTWRVSVVGAGLVFYRGIYACCSYSFVFTLH